LGVVFLGCQILEYSEASFSIRDSVYGRIFFATTGLHGMHVLVGRLFLLFIAVRISSYHFSGGNHLGFLFAA